MVSSWSSFVGRRQQLAVGVTAAEKNPEIPHLSASNPNPESCRRSTMADPVWGLGYHADQQDALLQHYLKECLEFHEEQEKSRQFVASEGPLVDRVPQDLLAKDGDAVDPVPPPPQSTPPDRKFHEELVAQARERAQKLLQKFEQRSDNSPSVVRQNGLATEAQRLRRALQRNLDYVTRREQVEASYAQSQYQQLLNQRQQRWLQTQAGIGTQQRQRAEKVQRKAMGRDASEAVYVDGLQSANEKVLRQVFGGYGSIQKVHFYHDKDTGVFKGDGLVVYRVSPGDQLIETVCAQVGFPRRV